VPTDTIGTRAWRDRTGGALSRRERLEHQAAALVLLTTDLSSRVRFPWAGGAQGLSVDAVPPQTALVRAATAWAEEVHEPWLLRHSLRTWMFGHLLGQLDGIDFDPDSLYLASLLHDVGLTANHRVPQGDGGVGCACFAVHGAHVSEQKLLELGASPLLASEVADAIGMHLNASVSVESGAAAHLVSQGAGLDVVGARASDVGRRLIGEVIARYDRTGFAAEFQAVLRAENVERPTSRTASFFAIGMGPAIRLNPLNRL